MTLKFTVRYQRKVQTRPYENMTIGLEMEFPIDHSKIDDERTLDFIVDGIYKKTREIVERWIDEALNP